MNHTQSWKLRSLKNYDKIFGNYSYAWFATLGKSITMCAHIYTRACAHAPLITAAMFLFVICVCIYSKQSCDLAIASLMVSPWIQCYLKPRSTKLARKANRNQSESSSAYYNAEEVTQDFSTETVMLSLLE